MAATSVQKRFDCRYF